MRATRCFKLNSASSFVTERVHFTDLLSCLMNWASLLLLRVAILLHFSYFAVKNQNPQSSKSIYEFTVQDSRGNNVPLINYDVPLINYSTTYKHGKVLLIVNVASKCGLTQSNYKELNILYEKYKDQGFEILAFPCNQFGWQEPGTNEEIENAVCIRYKAEFPIFGKQYAS